MTCFGQAQNGKRCERKVNHNGSHGNCWCSRCGNKLKTGKESWCTNCRNTAVRVRSKGNGPNGLLSRMRYLLRAGRRAAKAYAYRPPNISAQDLVNAWYNQKGRCAWTDRPITLFQAHLDHDHVTGEFRGFVIEAANHVEGLLATLALAEQEKFVKRVFPALYAEIRRKI